MFMPIRIFSLSSQALEKLEHDKTIQIEYSSVAESKSKFLIHQIFRLMR